MTLAALYVSSKMHDTLKKPREILMASYSVRFPEQAAKSKSIVGEIDMDPVVREGWNPTNPFRATAKRILIDVGSRTR